jgi:hypothetical protein
MEIDPDLTVFEAILSLKDRQPLFSHLGLLLFTA